jgi:putative transposase
VIAHALIATGVNTDGQREILGVNVVSSEDGTGWLVRVRSLMVPGLHRVALVTSDTHPGSVEAIDSTLPSASWRRCRIHDARNLSTKVVPTPV